VEKLLHEQMLKAMKKGFEVESKEEENRANNIIWTDDQRRNIIMAQIRRTMGFEHRARRASSGDAQGGAEEEREGPEEEDELRSC
jgi:hypothetical protein